MNKILCCLLLLIIKPSFAFAKDALIEFTATPKQCVALHKGQDCYQNVTFQWKTPDEGRYCLLQHDSKKTVTCWSGHVVQQFEYSFKGSKTTKFILIDQSTTDLLAEVKVEVTWVYKAPKQSQSGWRLF
ncbi:hypothetical protein A9264_11055 [Vibrio sp. UCD-FRSSP16_10]|uniref:DUF3019 domain-containing protein n=1 Tax=unclassified Vibrio TaxID=2614977 RepID=UPI0007FBA249|nr:MULTISPECIES: DUF3019 domain-containing protein [unclassified Vibrio]OBT16800.1 hypothetical protein A9260_11275 [Vibrio sp. UCD-FRSSP16_30]OBT21427.1 hypothetical protein A9264_11055 [Vibrio sp. UCD-FRSSP16_10]